MLRDQYVRDGDGFILVYSIIEKESFAEILEFRELIVQSKNKDKTDTSVPIILVGNKSDLQASREVATQDAKKLSEEWKVPFLETSAKTGENVEQVFHTIVQKIRTSRAPRRKKTFCQIL